MEWCQFFSNLATFLGSIVDVGSDVINSLDLLGQNATKWLLTSTKICPRVNFEDLKNRLCNPNNTQEILRDSWGYAGLGIIFLPGVVLFPYIVLGAIRNKYWKFLGLMIVLLPIYPALLILTQLFSLISFCRGAKVHKSARQIGLMAFGMEAFFESFCQLVLQGYTILYGYQVTITQAVSISFSLLALARTSILFDITMKKVDFGFIETLRHTASILPCYASAIVFRVTSFSLTIAYFRHWSILPISLLFVELAVVSYLRYRNVEEKSRRFVFVYLTCLSNAGVLNANNIGEFAGDMQDRKDDADGKRFIRRSSVITFIHHAVVLCTIMVLTKVHPKYFTEGRINDIILRPEPNEPHLCCFYWVFGVTLLVGFMSMMLALSNARKVSEVDMTASQRIRQQS